MFTRPRSGDVEADAESLIDLHDFFDDYQASGGGITHLLRSPARSLRAVQIALKLPAIAVPSTGSADDDLVHDDLASITAFLRTPLHRVSAAVRIPADIDEFDHGASMQTLRRKVRVARGKSIVWRIVEVDSEQRELMRVADEYEQSGADARYRSAKADNSSLVGRGLWLLATSRDGAPLLLSVTPTDGSLAVLRYFRTLSAGPDASAARYLMTLVLVQQLHALGIEYLIDNAPAIRLSSGLRHFQKMVGFTPNRLVFVNSRRRGRSSQHAPTRKVRAPLSPPSQESDAERAPIVSAPQFHS